SELKVVRLKNAEAESAAKLVLAIFRPDQNQSGNAQNNGNPFGGRGGRGGPMIFGPPGFGPPGMGQGSGQGNSSQDQSGQGKINAAADTRTNTVVVSGPPDLVR